MARDVLPSVVLAVEKVSKLFWMWLTYQFDELSISNAKNNFDRRILVLHWSDFLAVVVEKIFHQPELVVVTFGDCVCKREVLWVSSVNNDIL